MNKIPKSFRLISHQIEIIFDDDKMEFAEALGQTHYTQGKIYLSQKDNKGKEIPESQLLHTFYHEKVHHILHAMREDDLSKNEKFVDLFANLLLQSDLTVEYERA